MRIKNHQRFKNCYTISILIILLCSIFVIINTSAQEEKTLDIFIQKYGTEEIINDIFYEGEKYDILVDSESEYGFIYNVTISVPWANYVNNAEMPWITINAPKYEEYQQFIITASKEGYISAEKEITVFKGRLSVTIDRGIVEEEEDFTVTVTDQNNNKVEDVDIWLYGFENNYATTNKNGIAYLKAPEINDDIEINIMAQKEGYNTVSTTIRVEDIPPTLIHKLTSKILETAPILIGIISVIFAMLFVKYRNKTSRLKPEVTIEIPKNPEERFKDINEKFIKKSWQRKTSTNTEDKKTPSTLQKGPKIEEIRIHDHDKKKETKHITPEEETTKIKQSHIEEQWFEGTDHIKYKIDELTGEIDIQKADKWFEGVEDIKSKVDKKLQKNYKKKK